MSIQIIHVLEEQVDALVARVEVLEHQCRGLIELLAESESLRVASSERRRLLTLKDVDYKGESARTRHECERDRRVMQLEAAHKSGTDDERRDVFLRKIDARLEQLEAEVGANAEETV